MRLGCPTTSNSIEAIHHHINSSIPFRGSFVSRLQNVVTFLFRHFETKEQWHGNNYAKYVKKVSKHPSPNQTIVGSCQCGNYIFYSHLFGCFCIPCKHTICDYLQRFKEFKIPQIQELNENLKIQNNIIVLPIYEKLPNNWTSINKSKRIVENTTIFPKIKHAIGSDQEMFSISWEIIYSIKRILGKKKWKENKERIITSTLTGCLKVDPNKTEQMALWRIQCYLQAGINQLD